MKRFNALICLLMAFALLLSGCGKDYSDYKSLTGYKDYISIKDSGNKFCPYFGIDFDKGFSNDKDFLEYYNNNSRKCGSYLITDFEDGVCINRYTGFSSTVNIPSELDGKPVVALGAFVCEEKDVAYAEDDVIVYGAFGGVKNCKLSIPSTVKYISSNAFVRYYGIIGDLDTKYSNSFSEVTIDENNPYYCSENNCIFSKDKKTLLFVPSNEYYDVNTFIVPEFVENFAPLNALPDGAITHIEFSKNIKNIDTCVDLGEDGCTPCGYVKSGIIARGYSGTVAESWAEKNELAFEPIDDVDYTYDEHTSTLTFTGNGKIDPDNFISEPFDEIENPINIVISDGITAICENCFAFNIEGNTGKAKNYYDKIESVKLGNTVKKIGKGAFSYCKSLKSINLTDSLTEIGQYAFENCTSLESIEFPKGIEWIARGICEECTALKSVKFNSGTRNIGVGAFSNCINLESIEFSDTVENIGDEAFSGCDKLKSVTLPDSAMSIGEYAFSDCDSLESVTLGSSVKEIKSNAFSDCPKLKTVTVPESVTTIGGLAFGYYESDSDEILLTPGYAPIEGFTIRGYKGSAAEAYAKENNFNFEALN